MIRSRFLWKIYLGYAALILVCAVIAGIAVTDAVQRESLTLLDQELGQKARLVDALLGDHGPDGLPERVASMKGRVAARLTLIDAEGVVVADSLEDPSAMENHGDRPEILMARANGLGLASRYSTTVRRHLRYVALRRGGGVSGSGYVRVALPLDDIDARQARIGRIVALAAALAAGLALILAFFVARHFTRPLGTMLTFANALAEGDELRRLEITSRDEIGELARALNRSSLVLRERLTIIDEEREKLRTIIGSMIEGIIAVDSTERVVQLNPAAARLLGLPDAGVAGRPLREMIRVPAICELLDRAMVEDRPERGETILREHRTERVVEIRCAPLKDGRARPVGAVAVLHDVTELRRLGRMRQDFVANVSHELKTPVAAITGLAETLHDDPSMPEATRERFLKKVISQCGRLTALVHDLLTLSRLESGEEPEARGIVDVRHQVSDAVEMLQPVADSGGVVIEVDLPGEPATVSAADEAVRQIIDNLLSNAVKYTPNRGRVELKVWREGDRVYLSVRDTGIGIEREHLGRIFERFYRVDKARSREVGGTGLGLSIVKHRVQALGGIISVESAVGRGTRFLVELPAVDDE